MWTTDTYFLPNQQILIHVESQPREFGHFIINCVRVVTKILSCRVNTTDLSFLKGKNPTVDSSMLMLPVLPYTR